MIQCGGMANTLTENGKQIMQFISFLSSQFHHFLDKICPRCRSLWRNLPRFYRQLTINLILGLSIALIVLSLHHTRWITQFEDSSIDWLMSFYRGSAPSDKPINPFVLINIDEETYQTWGELLVTPRDNLQKLLHFAVTGQATIIVVDIDLSYPRKLAAQQPNALNEAGLQLYNYLKGYEKAECQKNCPHIILIRTFRTPLSAENASYDAQRQTFLDDIVANSHHIHWASPRFERESDRILRRWRLWESTCNGGVPNIVPSLSLLTLALITEPSDGAKTVTEHLQDYIPYDCVSHIQAGWWASIDVNKKPLIELGDLLIHLQPSRLNRRIFYTIPWKLEEKERRPNIPDGRLLLEKLSALKILDTPNIDNSLLRNSITVIGGSYAESRDFYATPIGWMPGALVLINAIHSMLQYGELNAPPNWLLLLGVAFVIIMMSILFTRYPSFWGMTLSGLVIILLILPISFYLFKYGVWLNFAIPLLIVQWRQMAANYQEAIKQWQPNLQS